MNRREFLRGATLTAIALGLVQSVPVQALAKDEVLRNGDRVIVDIDKIYKMIMSLPEPPTPPPLIMFDGISMSNSIPSRKEEADATVAFYKAAGPGYIQRMCFASSPDLTITNLDKVIVVPFHRVKFDQMELQDLRGKIYKGAVKTLHPTFLIKA